ncbi:MAG: GNAT family N-acetyltransferase [Flavisolibacter sp.]|nr:GNAT family N-acetyltransferase [Flavisolibacter sp.]
MEKKCLFSEGDYSIWRQTGIPAEAFSFLASIEWGNEGAVYEHRNTAEHISLLKNAVLLSITEKNTLQGTVVFCHTPVSVASHFYNSYYIRYFAASDHIRGKGVIKRYSIKVMELIRQEEKEKTIYFACVEGGNKASYNVIASAGYEKIGTIKTVGFSRFFPRAKNEAQQVTTEVGRQEVLSLLEKQYAQHSLVHFDSLFIHDNYFVIRENNEIVAGCQYHREHWVVNYMPGFSGKLIMKVVPKIPLLNRLFNPERFEFLAFEGIYFKPGYEKRLLELFEALLARERLESAIFWMGETCPHYTRIMEKGNLGLLHTFIKDSDLYVVAAFQNMNESETARVKENPMYASAFDYL